MKGTLQEYARDFQDYDWDNQEYAGDFQDYDWDNQEYAGYFCYYYVYCSKKNKCLTF